MIRLLKDKGFFQLLAARSLTQFLGFGSALLVAKLLTPTEFGNIRVLQSYTDVFTLLGNFGLSTAILKYCSENRPMREREQILGRALLRALISTGVSLALLVFLSLTGLITSSHTLALWLVAYAVVIPFAVATDILMVFLQSLKRIKQMARAQALIKVQSVFLIAGSTWLWGFKGFVSATVAGFIVGLLPLLRQVGLGFAKAGRGPVPPGFSRMAVLSLMANGVALLGQYTDIFLLDHLVEDRSTIGHYSFATLFLLAAVQVTGTVQSIATPYFSERAADRAWVRHQLLRTQIRMVPVSAAVALGTYVIATLLVETVYGPGYHTSLGYLAILLIKYMIWSSFAITGVALLGLGLVHYNLLGTGFATVAGMSFSYILLKQLGAAGVAWGQVAAALVNFIGVTSMAWLALRPTISPGQSKERGELPA